MSVFSFHHEASLGKQTQLVELGACMDWAICLGFGFKMRLHFLGQAGLKLTPSAAAPPAKASSTAITQSKQSKKPVTTQAPSLCPSTMPQPVRLPAHCQCSEALNTLCFTAVRKASACLCSLLLGLLLHVSKKTSQSSV